MNSIDTLTALLKKFPGVGPRQARRFVYFLLSQSNADLTKLAQNIASLKKDITQCGLCCRFFPAHHSRDNICDVCSSENTNTETMLVVEKDVDFDNVRKTGAYSGAFFILGGSIPIMDQNPAERIRIKELLFVVDKKAKEGLKEIILALSINPEGENTAQYIRKVLEPLIKKHGLLISTLGRGLSTGTELEYSDADTLQNALKNRN